MENNRDIHKTSLSLFVLLSNLVITNIFWIVIRGSITVSVGDKGSYFQGQYSISRMYCTFAIQYELVNQNPGSKFSACIKRTKLTYTINVIKLPSKLVTLRKLSRASSTVDVGGSAMKVAAARRCHHGS